MPGDRVGLRGALLGLLALLTASACSSEEAFLLLIRPPAGVAISQYEVTVQDRETRDIVYGSGIQSLPPSAQSRDLSVEPLRIGLKLGKKDGTYLVQQRTAGSPVEEVLEAGPGEVLGNKGPA